MKVHGREIKFLKTVGAVCKIADLCPDGDIQNLPAFISNGMSMQVTLARAAFIVAMNEGYEEAKAYEERLKGKEYTPNPLTIDELTMIPADDMYQLFGEACTAWAGEAPTVEVEEPKKKVRNKKAVTSD